ncbi:MAG TPA: BadF/BadG/BcrA/BcrD ATPase family protein [Acidothermaceae bacterium]
MPATETVYSIDAGGSRTTAEAARSGEQAQTWSRESFAIASAGRTQAQAVLTSLLDDIRAWADPDESLGCIASSSMPVGQEAPAPRSLVEVIEKHAPRGRVVIVNDVVPLLWSAGIAGVGIVLCSGTGSCVLGRDARGQLVKVGGHEHIISDQGSGYSLARTALRAAARDADSTGPRTKLRTEAETFFGRPLPALGRWLAELPRARTVVASFAPSVTLAAAEGDDAAKAITQAEAAALVDMVQAAASALSLGELPIIGFAGGVLHGSSYFRELVEAELAARTLTRPDRTNLHLIDGISAGAQFALRLARNGDGSTLPLPDGEIISIES